jgi:hypothetical protein
VLALGVVPGEGAENGQFPPIRGSSGSPFSRAIPDAPVRERGSSREADLVNYLY